MLSFKVVLALLAVIVPLLISHFTGGWVAVYTSHGFSVEQIPNLSGKVVLYTPTVSHPLPSFHCFELMFNTYFSHGSFCSWQLSLEPTPASGRSPCATLP